MTHESLHGAICEVLAVTKVQVVQVLPQLDNAMGDSPIGNILALCQDKIAEPGRDADDLVHALVCK